MTIHTKSHRVAAAAATDARLHFHGGSSCGGGIPSKRRLPQHVTPLATLRCRVEATSLRHHTFFLWLPPYLVYQVRVLDIATNDTWVTHCTPRDVRRLYQHLVRRSIHPDTVEALHVLRCPDAPLLQPRDGLAIKAMCVDTEHFLHNLLALCRQTTTAPDAAFVAFFVAAFLKTPRKNSIQASTHDGSNSSIIPS
ncbi:hypothetical protein H257_13283 [Aphanomyces astaci]|uniref:Uncharacterized protein n=1 Tax=Aphanomyces astaci TaxID=112090 RepID=W4FXJ2_APHAT|nr:hypothetical protein H257_13283 [Aphanomyces astaci]ETV71388.1 hypothetical protein H257_13283 [Aphanomyces astaci]RQM18988.1 hypothetical protein B5M09_005602 [Aphanomyces astaci]|eukprot:XP_009839053.1 hypothetical protein H257_13283 [Aphanomyces astaci]